MTQKRKDVQVYRYLFSDVWVRLKLMEQMEDERFVKHLRAHQLCPKYNLRVDWNSSMINETNEESAKFLGNSKRSRLFNFHVHPDSDRFENFNQSYVGLMLFSYKQQLRFILGQRYCQIGDIFIRKLSSSDRETTGRRFIYDNLFNQYFSRIFDQNLLAVGFYYDDGRFQFDTITSNHQQLLWPFEYRILDMFILTRWFLAEKLQLNVSEMENRVIFLIDQQYQRTIKRINDLKNSSEFVKRWNEITGTDQDELSNAIQKIQSSIEKEADVLNEMRKRPKLDSFS